MTRLELRHLRLLHQLDQAEAKDEDLDRQLAERDRKLREAEEERERLLGEMARLLGLGFSCPERL